MASDATLTDRRGHWRIAWWSGAALLLALPFVAMRFTSEVNWDETDFVVFGAMLLAVGGALEFLLRRGGWLYRFGAAVAVVASFLLIWVNLAVGIFGNEDNPANLMFAGVIAVAIGGAVVARFRAHGMALAMLGAAAAQTLVSVIALADGWTAPGTRGFYEAAVGVVLFGGLWLLSAGLFHLAARR